MYLDVVTLIHYAIANIRINLLAQLLQYCLKFQFLFKCQEYEF